MIISLIITAINVTTWRGMIFERPAEMLGEYLDRMNLSVLRKPLYECPMCMGGFWTVVIYPVLYGWSWWIVPTMAAVIGMNTVLAAAIKSLHEDA